MSKYEKEILDTVALHGTVSVMALADQLKVTDQTIRRIVKPMVERGEIRKVHGAIVAVNESNDPPLTKRLVANRQEKAIIARTVAEVVPNGATLAIDTGSTSSFVAQALSQHRDLTVVTNSAHIAAVLALSEGNQVYMAGTQLRSHDGAAFDQSAFEVVSRFTVDMTILSASLVHPELGFLANDQHEVDMAIAMSRIADRRIMAVDHSKWMARKANAPLRMPVMRPDDILVTDRAPDAAYDDLLADLDLRLPRH
ncbi:DeoR/GlpR family DNA-binding transcription regulator [Salipiger abyssi]|uniref:Transcriptional regulator, DeoR family n=1 Tax=Salipiger abyssi TaxID=1250539 RepID=A0A1P8UMZ1_9RHOB|nr:DeoR/GlpR family DNA-binding transcription regulator [Salipiger abyssi]APZ50766.1 transcriptional regulator, DeoR family [Salipiger abyssi]